MGSRYARDAACALHMAPVLHVLYCITLIKQMHITLQPRHGAWHLLSHLHYHNYDCSYCPVCGKRIVTIINLESSGGTTSPLVPTLGMAIFLQ